MQKIILVDPKHVRCDEDEIDQYLAVLNGIVVDCMESGYRLGYRNMIMVNLVVSSYELGLEPETVLNEFKRNVLIDDRMDDERPIDRLNKIMKYTDSFCWEWMIEPEAHVDYDQKGNANGEEERDIVFKLSD
jgi:hypothetical protein